MLKSPPEFVTAMETVGLAGDAERKRDSSAPSIDASAQSQSLSFSSAKEGNQGISTNDGLA